MKLAVYFEAADFPTVEVGTFDGDRPAVNDVVRFAGADGKPYRGRVLSVEEDAGHLYVTTERGSV